MCAHISITAARIIPATLAATIESPIMLNANPSQYVEDIVDDILQLKGDRTTTNKPERKTTYDLLKFLE